MSDGSRRDGMQSRFGLLKVSNGYLKRAESDNLMGESFPIFGCHYSSHSVHDKKRLA